jgi:hypothetical protein
VCFDFTATSSSVDDTIESCDLFEIAVDDDVADMSLVGCVLTTLTDDDKSDLSLVVVCIVYDLSRTTANNRSTKLFVSENDSSISHRYVYQVNVPFCRNTSN